MRNSTRGHPGHRPRHAPFTTAFAAALATVLAFGCADLDPVTPEASAKSPELTTTASMNGVITACYNPGHGNVYLIGEPGLPDECVGMDVEFSWNMQGPAGQDGTDGVSGYEEHIAQANPDDTSPKTVEATCDPGKVILGGGAQVTPETGPDNPPPVAITRSFGFVSAATGEPTWRVTAQEFTPTSITWSVIAVIYCADAS
jgi:hypothetical protein